MGSRPLVEHGSQRHGLLLQCANSGGKVPILITSMHTSCCIVMPYQTSWLSLPIAG